jgi:hypothetical protein
MPAAEIECSDLRPRICACAAGLVLAFCLLAPPAYAEDARVTPAATAPSGGSVGDREPHAPTPRPGSIDYRVQLLTAELKLDPGQQVKVRQILEDQRRQTIGAWQNDAVPAAVRVHTTQLIGERAADRIRAVLSETQRENYIKPQPAIADHGQSTEKVDSWINAVDSH